jgi:prepilin-type N-terminal cleavage/methylation domain-containing protein/prepilin-type processing-associated H-X9-DG protein
MPVFRHSDDRRGFTLVELLVVLAIAAVVIGLLLSAVHQVRQAATRLQCQNNIKQIVLGLHSYHNCNNWLPPQYGWDRRGNFGTLFFHLLRFVDQKGLYERAYVRSTGSINVDLNEVPEFPPNPTSFTQKASTHDLRMSGIDSTLVLVYVCPADPEGPKVGASAGGARSSYGSNFIVFGKMRRSPGTAFQNGFFDGVKSSAIRNWNGRARFADITDGLSNTILVAEKRGECQPGLNQPSGGSRWGRWKWLDYWQPVYLAWEIGPSSMFQDNPSPDNCYPWLAQSSHPGGINVGLADGSVRFLGAGIGPNIWWALNTPNGGEPLASD